MDYEGQTAATIGALRARIAQLEGRAHEIEADAPGARWRFGLAPLDAATGGGLRGDALHLFRPAGLGDIVAAEGLVLALAAAGAKSAEGLLWVTTAAQVREWGRPYGPGLSTLGLAADRLLIVETRRPAEAAWAIEEGLKSRAFAAVLGAGAALDFPASRRLALAAADHRCPCLLVDSPANRTPLAATTMWQVAASRSRPDRLDPAAPGGAAWRVELQRLRGGPPAGPWELTWDEAAHRLALAIAFADRAAAPALPHRRDAAEPVRAERSRAARA